MGKTITKKTPKKKVEKVEKKTPKREAKAKAKV